MDKLTRSIDCYQHIIGNASEYKSYHTVIVDTEIGYNQHTF